jgi:hypothetical protein
MRFSLRLYTLLALSSFILATCQITLIYVGGVALPRCSSDLAPCTACVYSITSVMAIQRYFTCLECVGYWLITVV